MEVGWVILYQPTRAKSVAYFTMASSLIPAYGGRQLATLTLPQYRALQGAYYAGKFAWAYRRQIGTGLKMAGRGVKRVYRSARHFRSKRRRMNQIGFRPGKSTAKKTFMIYDGTAGSISTRTLYIEDLSQLEKQTSSLEINKREREMVNLRGIKFCMELRNDTVDTPLYFNWAVISPKASASPSDNDFFRGYANDRSDDFNASLTSNDFHCRPINSDAYIVLTHRRLTLGGKKASDAYKDTVPLNYRNVMKYMKIKRQVRYDTIEGGQAAQEGRKLFLVYWCDGFMTDGPNLPVANSMTLNRQVILYFREPK